MNYISDLRVKSAHYIIAGFSLVVGLSWNDTIKKIIETVFPAQSDIILMKIIYSLIITLLLVVIIKYLPDTTSQLPEPIKKELFNRHINREYI